MTLDIEIPGALAAYLCEQGWIDRPNAVEVEQLTGGVSNRTMFVRRREGEDWIVKQALPKLRVDVEWMADPARAEREALALEFISPRMPTGAAPRLIFFDRERHILAMEAVPAPHENYKTVLLAGEADAGLLRQFAELLAAFHRLGASDSSLLATTFADRSYFESLRLEPYYLYTAEQLPDARKFLHDVVAQTRLRSDTIVHGDFSPKNVLIQDGRLVLLDFEVIHWGDAAFDVGFAMAHLLSKAHHLPACRTKFAEGAFAFWRDYERALASPGNELAFQTGLETRSVDHSLACLLARTAGRSKLEYLSSNVRQRQIAATLPLVRRRPASIAELVARFVAEL